MNDLRQPLRMKHASEELRQFLFSLLHAQRGWGANQARQRTAPAVAALRGVRPLLIRHLVMQMLRGFLLLGMAMGLSGSLIAQENKAGESIVLRVKHFHTRGPCIPIAGGGLAMPIIDAFQVLEVVKGSLPKSVRTIQVRALSGNLPNVKKGEVNVLRLTRSADTKSQLKERAKDGNTWLWVSAGELKVEETPK